MRAASLHISWVFKSSGTSVKKLGLMYTNHFHGTCFNVTLIFCFNFPEVSQILLVKFYVVNRYKKVYVYAHNFSVSFFSSSDIHQSQCLDGSQVMGRSSSFIFTFRALCFLYPSYHSKKLSLPFIYLFNKYLEGINTSVTIVTAISVSPE